MIKRLAIIGASGHGKVIVDIAASMGIADISFYDDRWMEIGELCGIPVVGSVSDAKSDCGIKYDVAIVAIGNAETRALIQKEIKFIAPALIHLSAVVSPSAQIGNGTVIMPNTTINAGSVIGEGAIINSGAVIEHDCKIGNYSHISPNTALAGGVSVGSHSWLGIGSSIIQLVNVGDNVIVGAGSVVIRDVADNQTVVGIPANPLKR